MQTKTKILLCFLKRKEKKSYVKVKKKVRDEEGGKNQKMKESDYVQMIIYKEVGKK